MTQQLNQYTIEELLTGVEHGSGWSDSAKQAAREELKGRGFEGYTLADLKRLDLKVQQGLCEMRDEYVKQTK